MNFLDNWTQSRLNLLISLKASRMEMCRCYAVFYRCSNELFAMSRSKNQWEIVNQSQAWIIKMNFCFETDKVQNNITVSLQPIVKRHKHFRISSEQFRLSTTPEIFVWTKKNCLHSCNIEVRSKWNWRTRRSLNLNHFIISASKISKSWTVKAVAVPKTV